MMLKSWQSLGPTVRLCNDMFAQVWRSRYRFFVSGLPFGIERKE
jgi:hypothetical protein